MEDYLGLIDTLLGWIGDFLDHQVDGYLKSMSPALLSVVITLLIGVVVMFVCHRWSNTDRIHPGECGKPVLGKKQHRKKKHRTRVQTTSTSDNYPVQEVYQEARQNTVESLCSLCKLVLAKRGCRYKACRSCCRRTCASICRAHGTGELVAEYLVEAACQEKHLELDISYTNLKSCPQKLGYVGSQLTSLNISNNRLTSLPLEVGFLRGLQELFLQYNCLEELPDCIGNLDCLQELDCKNNQLRRLPPSIGEIKQLRVLNLTNNLLLELPDSIGQLTLMEELCVHSNRLKALPDTMCNLIELRELYLGENHRLRHLPEDFGHLIRLSELDVSSCALENLPESFSNCTSLTKLWMSYNKLKYLPDHLGRLHQLKELHLCNNQLQYFPASMSYLELYTFRATNNPLLHEGEQRCNQLRVTPLVSVPPLEELTARLMVKEDMISRYPSHLMPAHLRDKLKTSRRCSCCGDPFFDYYESDLCFATVFVFHRLPLYQQICSPHLNQRCSAIHIQQRHT